MNLKHVYKLIFWIVFGFSLLGSIAHLISNLLVLLHVVEIPSSERPYLEDFGYSDFYLALFMCLLGIFTSSQLFLRKKITLWLVGFLWIFSTLYRIWHVNYQNRFTIHVGAFKSSSFLFEIGFNMFTFFLTLTLYRRGFLK